MQLRQYEGIRQRVGRAQAIGNAADFIDALRSTALQASGQRIRTRRLCCRGMGIDVSIVLFSRVNASAVKP